MPQVALTTDIGEGYGRWQIADDEALLGLVTGANIACGFHAGDPGIMRETCAVAVRSKVSIGAQVSYRDLQGFGRRYIAYERSELVDDLLYQIGALEPFARLAGGRVEFVRAHGALYNAAATNADHAGAIVDAVRQYDASLPLLCQSGTETWRQGEAAGLRMVAEGFADRAYSADGQLVPRSEPGALVTDPLVAAAQAVELATSGRADVIVVHSDTTGALEIARATRSALDDAGVELVSVR